MFFLLLFSLHLSSFFLHCHLPKSFFLSSAESCVERLNIYIDSRFKGLMMTESCLASLYSMLSGRRHSMLGRPKSMLQEMTILSVLLLVGLLMCKCNLAPKSVRVWD
ncbi:uncharacterized protein [Coffea arabica]|uniref:Secreted protein n=1 Tax=Coffea arabica TaxID=13443 RepID=A0ABM4W5R9_COFAR